MKKSSEGLLLLAGKKADAVSSQKMRHRIKRNGTRKMGRSGMRRRFAGTGSES